MTSLCCCDGDHVSKEAGAATASHKTKFESNTSIRGLHVDPQYNEELIKRLERRERHDDIFMDADLAYPTNHTPVGH